MGLEVGDDCVTFLPLFFGFQVNDAIGHIEFGDEAPFVFLRKCAVGLLYDVGNGLIGVVW